MKSTVGAFPAILRAPARLLLFGAVLPGLLVLGAGMGGRPAAAASFTSAVECGRCHQDLYESWHRTFHAQAADNPVFLGDLEKEEKAGGRGARVNCLSCHSPTTAVTMDYSLSLPVSREGVTCDFCHTVSAVDLKGAGPRFTNDVSPVKMGPGREGSLAAHRTAKNPLLLQSEFCAGCHQWSNPQGVQVLDTYREWQSSPYRGDMLYCQFCHMPEILKTNIFLQGRIVQRPSRLHFEMGGHSQTQLAAAARLGLEAVLREGVAEAHIAVENFKAGHMLPTGLPSRSVILQITMTDGAGRVLYRKEKAYRRILADAQGRVTDDVPSWFRDAARVTEDNRIAPKEKRREVFAYKLPEGAGAVTVSASLKYRLRVRDLSPPWLDYEMASAGAIVGQGTPRGDITTGMAVALAALMLALIALILIKFRLDIEGEQPED